jgi:hypothetical protein
LVIVADGSALAQLTGGGFKMIKRTAVVALLSGFVAVGCSSTEGGDSSSPPIKDDNVSSSRSRTWVVYDNPYGNGRENPAKTLTGEAQSFVVSAEDVKAHPESFHAPFTAVNFSVRGLPKSRAFASHVHAKACDDDHAGGHYKDVREGPATAENEIWLNFMTNNKGEGVVGTWVPFAVRPGEAKSIVIHDADKYDATGQLDPVNGKNPKLVCINLTMNPIPVETQPTGGSGVSTPQGRYVN